MTDPALAPAAAPPRALSGRGARARLARWLVAPVSVAPLASFRVLFGLAMVFSTVRFWALGWIEDQYLNPVFHFKYFGFAWVSVPPAPVLYGLYALLLLAAVGVTLGLYYRAAAVTFFLIFTYVELLDVAYYLNHYYFVSLVAFLLIWLPAHRAASLDVRRGAVRAVSHVPRWVPGLLMFQVGLVYFGAGVAKINADWLLHALPLKIWLPAQSHWPVVGPLFQEAWVAYAFSWGGMVYDVLVPFALLWRPTRPWAYAAVVGFHALTGLMFPIGVFPVVMIAATLLFFSAAWHQRWWRALSGGRVTFAPAARSRRWRPVRALRPWLYGGALAFVVAQSLLPWRYLLYPGNLFWTEEGYRFSWRVMLMEKAGTATFYVRDAATGREGEVDNREFLNVHQEKQMAFQPDLILQYAHFLAEEYARRGVTDPAVRVEAYVTLNARRSRLLIDPARDLTQVEDGFAPKDWILPAPDNF